MDEFYTECTLLTQTYPVLISRFLSYRCEEACLALHEETRRRREQELLAEEEDKLNQATEDLKHQLTEASQQIEDLSKELADVKELYVTVCRTKDSLEETLTSEYDAKIENRLYRWAIRNYSMFDTFLKTLCFMKLHKPGRVSIACLTNNNKWNHDLVGEGQGCLFGKVCRIINTNRKNINT